MWFCREGVECVLPERREDGKILKEESDRVLRNNKKIKQKKDNNSLKENTASSKMENDSSLIIRDKIYESSKKFNGDKSLIQ